MQSFIPYSPFRISWMGFVAIAGKEIRRFLRIYSQTLITPIIMVGLYFLVFGKVLGNRMGDVSGYHYTQYIAPGLIIMSIFNNAFGNVAHSFFMHKFQGIIYSILITPTPVFVVYMGFITGGILRGVLVGSLVFLATTFFIGLTIHSWAYFFIIMLLTSSLFATFGLLIGAFAKNFDQVAIFPTFILTPLTYLGGVFFPISMLSESIQLIAKFNPIYYIIDAFRFSMLGISETNINISVGILVLIYTICFVTIFLLAKFNYLKK